MTVRLTDEGLKAVLGLLRGSDTAELKLTLPDSDIRSTVQALGIDPLDAEIRQVVFFDTTDLALNRAGVVARARRVQGGRADTVVKLRPVVPEDLPSEFRASKNLGVEVDAMPGGYVCSASMKGEATSADVRQVILGEKETKSLFTKEQRAFFRANAPEGLGFADLKVLGPILVLKLKFAPEGFERKMVGELWMYPDGSRIVELSTKCLPTEAFQVAAETRAYFAERGVDLSGEQQTKTKAALEYFATLGTIADMTGGEQLHGSD